MFLSKYNGPVLKWKLFLPTTFIKTSNAFKEISNEPLQKSKGIPEANFANKADDKISPQEKSFGDVQSKQDRENVNVYFDDRNSVKTLTTPPHHTLIQRKEATEALLHADPFEEVPGPEFLKKMSMIWKFLPEIGCQAAVSTMLSFFNLTQQLSKLVKLGKSDSRPFDRLFSKYGPLVKLQGPLGADIVLVSKAEHIAKVYDHEGKHPVRSTLDSIEKCRSRTRKNCEGPFNVSGIEWEDLRRALQAPLKRGGEKYFDAIEQASDLFVNRISAIKNRRNEVSEDFMTEVTKWSMECLCFVILGKSLGFLSSENVPSSPESVRLLKAFVDATFSMGKCEAGFQLWRFVNTPSSVALTQACQVIDTLVSKYIRLAQVNLSKNKEEIINLEKTEAGLPFIEGLLLNECMAPDEILTCIVDLLLIGANTTSSTLAFTLYHLAQNQRTQRILYKELKECLSSRHTKLQYQQLSSLKYLDACLNESLRLRMPMPTLTRVLPHDISLSNFRIPKGTYMVMDAQAPCLKEQNFEKCDKFIPERWFDPSNIQPFSYIPFGRGSRSCIGKNLAEVQLKLCIAKIVRNYQIEYNYGEIQGTKTFISFPEKPLKLSFTEREE